MIAFFFVRLASRLSFKQFWFRGQIPEGPCFIFSNHAGWWDGVLWMFLLKELKGESQIIYQIMDQVQLDENPILFSFGARGFKRNQGVKGVRQLLRDLKKMIAARDCIILFYPQGKIFPSWSSDFQLKPGYKWLRRQTNIPCYAAFIHQEPLNHFRRHIFFQLEKLQPEDDLEILWTRQRSDLLAPLSTFGEDVLPELERIGFKPKPGFKC